MRANLNLLFLAVFPLLFFSCKTETEDFQSEELKTYIIPLQVGKYITYQLDSTVFTNFGRNTERHKYQEKNIVDAQIPDALGRMSYRIFRYLRDSAGTQAWKPSGSYMLTPLKNTIELTDNNLRFINLVAPVKQDVTWKGNRYLPEEPYDQFYNFNNDFDIADWDNTYTSIGESELIKGKTYNDILTVDGINDIINVPVTDVANYGSINFQQDKYAKGIGMVLQELIMWEYQPNTGGQGGGFKVGFGVKRSIIDHN